jgi:signal recognition particle receptor subunit alpha
MNNKSHVMFRHSKIGYVGVEVPVQLGGGVGRVETLGAVGIATPTLSALPFLSPCNTDTIPAISSDVTVKRKKKGKVLRKWGDEVPSESEMASLDFSYEKQSDLGDRPASNDLQSLVDEASLGSRTMDGLYEVKDWEFANGGTADDVIAKALSGNLDEESKPAQSSLGALGSLFARFTGTKVLSEDDLKPVLEGMKQHLMKKNVAKDISEKVCEGVGQSLVGKKVGGFQSTFDAYSTQRNDS